jgi:hypothetical protein
MQNECQEMNNKKLQLIEKAENSFQEYDLLFYEITTLKQTLISHCEKITQTVLNNILKINNPNDSIYFLMKTFYWIIKGFESGEKKNNLEWEYIQKNLNYESIISYLSFISESNIIYLTNEDLDEAMPFMVNYDKLKSIYLKISEDLIIILDFIKISLEFNVKSNIMNSLYTSNCNKNTKIDKLTSSINELNNLIQKAKIVLLQIIKDYKNYKEMNLNEENQIKNGYLILEKYSLFERYSVENERHASIGDISTIKFIIKLNKKYRDKEKFILHLSSSLVNFNKGHRKLDELKFIDDIRNANSKKGIKGRNYNRKYELNSIKEENYSSSINNYSRNNTNIYDSKNNYSNNITTYNVLTGEAYSYNYNYNWYENNNNIFNTVDNSLHFPNIPNKKKLPLVIRGNIKRNDINCIPIQIPSLNLLLKQSNNGTLECDQTKGSEISDKTFLNCKSNDISARRINKQKDFFIPQGQGSLTLEKEENNNYCSYFCFKSKI